MALFYVNRIYKFRLTKIFLDSILVVAINGNEKLVTARNGGRVLELQRLFALSLIAGR